MNHDTSLLSGTTGLVIGIALVLQALFAVTGLVVLARTPSDRLLFGSKWPWAFIIVFISMIGTILFLAAGRRPAAVADGPRTPSANTARTVEDLYGGEHR